MILNQNIVSIQLRFQSVSSPSKVEGFELYFLPPPLRKTEKGDYCRNPASNYAVNSLIKPPSSTHCETEFDVVTDVLDIGQGVPLDAPESEKSSTSIITETDADT
ncbi:hypothetical protein FQA39_LY14729 [Lamprigera yunnana]|nr:hypothetical protein FQA39_LY14729 [Lamprigera yunnana]